MVYAFRGDSCLGAIRLDGPDLSSIGPSLRDELIAASELLVTIYEDRFAFDLLGSLQHPVDFSQSNEDFFREIGLLIATSSGMEFVALREPDGDRLSCTAIWGFEDFPDERKEWDLEPLDAYPAFKRALGGETVAISNTSGPDMEALRRHTWSEPIQSFVATPIRVGTEILGVISVAARCPFEYAPLECRGFESIANGIGVSIKNFRNSRELTTQISQQTEAAVAITGMEVARAARHEGLGHIDNAFFRVRKISRLIAKPSVELVDEMEGIQHELRELSGTLNKIKFATKPPDAKWEIIRLKALWDQARNAVAGRLMEERIDVYWHGPTDLAVRALPDWLRQVFLNLLLNSVDAFRDARARGRRIDLLIERPSERANTITMTYRDNATGINPQRLHVPPEYSDEPVYQQVFEPSVTSKPEGSGFGLWLVRHILNDHGGSVDLTDYRQGVTFVIRLPKRDDRAGQRGSKV